VVRVRGLHRGVIVLAVMVGVSAGCGGGGGGSGGSGSSGGGSGYGSPMPMPMPMPTVMFTAPMSAATINLGQAVQLAWTSTNATSCSATASNMTGSAFPTNPATNGNATVAPTGSGSLSFTLTCMGAGGSVSATSPMITVNPSILSTLSTAKIKTIGSTKDPKEHGGNPYGLVMAPATAGLITVGDLVICNFNDGLHDKQGFGTTIVGLNPTPGSNPYRIAQSSSLEGCNALTMLPDDSISAAAFSAGSMGMNPLVTPAGVVNDPFMDGFANPWGEAYAAANGQNPAAIYVSNFDGSIDRIALSNDVQSSFTQIATGFCTSGSPGLIYAPAGLTYDPSIDTLYIVDTSSNSVVAFDKVSSIGAAGVVVNGQCKSVTKPPTPALTFTGPSASSARVIAHGSPLIAPISAALLSDGNLIVTNGDLDELDPATQQANLAVEISPVLPGGFVGQPIQLDSGNPAALFGVVATVDSQRNEIIYFNDDNDYTLRSITK
jgi:hypothetical protein